MEKPEAEEHEEHEDVEKFTKEPSSIISFIVKRPCVAFGVFLAIHLFFFILTVGLAFQGYDILPIEFGRVPLELTKDDSYLRTVAWRNRDEKEGEDVKDDDKEKDFEDAYQRLFLFFRTIDTDDTNVLQKSHLETIASVEERLTTKLTSYKEFCGRKQDGTCGPTTSVLRFFDQMGQSTLDIPETADITQEMRTKISWDKSGNVMKQLPTILSKDFDIAETDPTAKVVRTVISYTALKSDSNDTEKTPWERLESFMVDEVRAVLDEMRKDGDEVGGLEVYHQNGLLVGKEIQRQVYKDMALALLSFTFIFVFMAIQTRSLFITGFGMLSIVFSFLEANMFYRVVLDYRYFGIFHVLAIFIILGIGADDIFVFFDTWRLTYDDHAKYKSDAHRLSYAYRKAAKAMLITSITTACAFFANATSPILAISSFGLFAGLVVITNYFSVITFFPAAVYLYHVMWEDKKCCCCCPTAPAVGDSGDGGSKTKGNSNGAIVRFFSGPFFKLVSNTISGVIILILVFVFLAVFIFYATKLRPNEEELEFWKPGHHYDVVAEISKEYFAASDEDPVIEVLLVWGLKEQDRTGCHKTDYKCNGKVVLDPAFDLNPPPAQHALLEFCKKLKYNMTEEDIERLRIKKNVLTNMTEVVCFMDDMDMYLDRVNNVTHGGGEVWKIPTSTVTMRDIMSIPTYHDRYNLSQISKFFYRHFEMSLSYWLNEGYIADPDLKLSPEDTKNMKAYKSMIGLEPDTFEHHQKNITQGDKTISVEIGQFLKYAAIKVNLTLRLYQVGYPEGVPVMNSWEDFMTDEVSNMPRSLQGGVQLTPSNNWNWLLVQKSLAKSAFIGMGFGVTLALFILIVATTNVIVGFLATLTIIFITASVCGVIPMAGWKLGMLESLNLSLVVGLAVDYVVHLAEGYHHALSLDRASRVQHMLHTVGISVLSGAFTTLGASMFMCFAQILFFMQFGLFMFCTIGFSLFYSLFFFTVVLALTGPQGSTGSLTPASSRMFQKMRGRGKHDELCETCHGKGFHRGTAVVALGDHQNGGSLGFEKSPPPSYSGLDGRNDGGIMGDDMEGEINHGFNQEDNQDNQGYSWGQNRSQPELRDNGYGDNRDGDNGDSRRDNDDVEGDEQQFANQY